MGGIKPDFLDTEDIFASVDTTVKTGAPEAPPDIFASVDIGTDINGAPTVKTAPTTGFFARAPGGRAVDASQGVVRNLSNYLDNRADDVVNSMIGAAEGTVGLFKDPQATGGFIKETVKNMYGMVTNIPEAVQKFGLKHAVMNKFAGDMILSPLETYLDNLIGTPLEQLIINPFIIATTGSQDQSEEQLRAQAATAIPDVLATIVGAKIGKVIAESQLANNAAGMMAKKLAINPATATGRAELASKMAALPTDEIIAMSKEIPTMIKVQNVVTRAIAEGVSGGTVAGMTMPGTPEEKFNNAFQMSVFGVPFALGIHGAFKVAGKVREGFGYKTPEQIVRQAAVETYENIQLRRLTGLPPSERFAAGQHFLDGVSAPEIIARNIDRGIVYNIPIDVKTHLGDNGITYYDHGDGTFSALVDKTKNVEQEAYQTYPEGLEARKASATAEADAKMMRDLEITDPEKHAQIERLMSSKNPEDVQAGQALKNTMEQRDFTRRELFKDPLTQVANRRALDLALPAAEKDPNVHIMVSDLDGFKLANDTHGHPAGDAVLRAFSQHVRNIMEKYHLPIRDVFRYGGDEFVTFVRSPDPLLVERVKAEIDAFKHTVADDLDKPPVEVKVSTGNGQNLPAADRAMYDIKGIKKGKPVTRTPIQESSSFFTDADRAHFKATGFVPYQKVSYNGKDWFVSKIAGTVAQLLDSEGNATQAEVKALRRTPQLEVASPHMADINQLLAAPIDEANIPKEPGFKRTIDDASKGFRAELIKPLDQVDIRAKSQPNQPPYTIDPDINKVQKGYRGLQIDFNSDFDKAVWQVVRSPEEMKNLGATRKLHVETRMFQLAKKLGVTIKELIAHKVKLLNEVAKAQKEFNEEMNDIGMEPPDPWATLAPGEMRPVGGRPSSPYVGIGTQPFEGTASKFMGIDFNKVGTFVNAGKFTDLLNPEEKAIVESNKAAFAQHNNDILKGKFQEMNNNGMTIQVNGSGVDVVGPDGKVKATFNTIDDALNYRMQANHPPNNGMSDFGAGGDGGITNNGPPANVGGDGSNTGNPPPSAGNVDGPYIDPYDEANWINKLVGAAQQARQHILKPRHGFFRDMSAQFGLPEIGVAGLDFDVKALEGNSLTVRYRSQLQAILKNAAKIDRERIKLAIGTWLNTGSETDFRSNQPGRRIDITRPTTDVEFSKGAEIARLAKAALRDGEAPLDPLYRVSKFITGIKKLSKDYPSENAKQNPEYIHQMSQLEAMLKEDPATSNLLVAMNDIVSQPKSVADIWQVIALAEAELTKSLDKKAFAEVNKMTPQELSIAEQLRGFFKERAVEQGSEGDHLIRQMDMTGRYNGGTYEGSIFAAQESINPRETEFLGQLIRDIDNVDFQKDPFAVANNLINASIRNRILRPARVAFLERVNNAARDLSARGIAESLRRNDTKMIGKYNAMAEKLVERATDFVDEAIGKPHGWDETANNVVNTLSDWVGNTYRAAKGLEKLKPGEEHNIDVKRDVLGPLNRLFESAAQGFKPAAGVMDLSYGVIKLAVTLPIDRFVKVLQVGAKGIDQAAELQRQGKIAGLQVIVPEDLSNIRSSATGLHIREKLTAGSDIGFSLSGQPAVFKYLSASLWVENIGAMSDAIKKHGNDALAVRKELHTRMLGPATNNELNRLLLAGNGEAAAEFYAHAMQHLMIVQYGRAAHPAGFGNVFGRFAGTFGSWSMGAIDGFLQPLQYGTKTEAAVYTAKVVGAYWAIKEIQDKSGLNLRRYMFNPFDWQTWRGSPLIGLGGTISSWAYHASSGNDRMRKEDEWNLRNYMPNGQKNISLGGRLVPFSPEDKNWGSILVPASMGMQNAREALNEMTQGHFLQAGLRGIGIRPLPK